MISFYTSSLRSCLLVGIIMLLFVPTKFYAQGFTNVSASSGVSVTHTENSSDIVDFSSGAAWFDYDQDGDLDLYITMRNTANLLYRNNGNGTFAEVAATLGAGDPTGDGGGVSIADFNNDGWPDIFLANANENVLLRNNNGISFSDITSTTGLAVALNSRSTTGSWGDFDADGYLDLYVSQHIPVTGNGSQGSTQKDFLFRNNRDETFTDVSAALPTADISGYGFVASWTDFDKDGDLDLFLVNDCDPISTDPNESTRTRIFRNDNGGNPNDWFFNEVSVSIGINDCRSARGLGIGDYNRDGLLDYFYTNTGNCVLWENSGNHSFADVTAAANITTSNPSHASWGSTFFDYDNDGYQDIFVAVGPETGSAAQPNQVFKNNGTGTFTEVGSTIGMDNSGKTRNIVYGDYDNDGDLDAFVLNYGQACALMRNDDNSGNHFLKVDLEGVYSNKEGIGSRIEITTPDGASQIFETRSGSNLGAGDQVDAHFGLGTNTTVTEIKITWPSGIVQVFNNIPADVTFEATESNTVSFTNVNLESGVEFLHDGHSFADMSVGTGAAWFDFDNDGYLDLYTTMRTQANQLYHNNGDGTFTEKAVTMGLGDANNNGSGVAVADFDNDGWQDIYLCNGDWDKLYKNIGGTSFQDVTANSGLDASGTARGNSATWGDYDNDGYLDLFISNHVPLDANDPNATNQDFLFHNNGDGTFTDVSASLTIDPNLDGYGFIGGWTDFDNDGDLDILLVNDCNFSPIPGSHLSTPNKLFRNDGGTDPLNWNFTEVASTTGAADCRNGMGLAIGDYDRDGNFDAAWSNIGPLAMFKNTGGVFENFAGQTGMGGNVSTDYWSWGISFWDYDMDGWQDVIVSMGAMSQLPTAVPHPNHLYRNNGDGTFSEVADALNLDNVNRTRNAIHGDYDNDGDLDLFVVNYGQLATLMRNDIANNHHYLKINLEGTLSNRDGIGSRLKLTMADGGIQYFETRSGSNLGGGDMIDAYFGLGTNASATELEITWPSGIIQTITNPGIDQCLQIVEPSLSNLKVRAQVLLEGTLSGSLMTDHLRAGGYIPAGEPYAALGLSHVNGGGGEIIADYAGVMGVTGDDAIVDWIFLELRSKADPTSVVGTRSALLQSDGDIVDVDGISPVTFSLLPEDDYYIAIRHRNHFGVRSANAYPLTGTAGAILDFSNPSFATYGTNAQSNVSGLHALIAGEANLDGQINAVDKNGYWRPQNGQAYNYHTSTADFNLDGAINAVDKNALWRLNNSKVQQLD